MVLGCVDVGADGWHVRDGGYGPAAVGGGAADA